MVDENTIDPEGTIEPSLAPVSVQTSMVLPAATIDEAVAAFEAYQELKTKLGRPEDFQTFWSGGKEHTFAKKSFVRKVARYFNISAEEVSGAEKILQDADGVVTAVLTRYRAVAPNGAFMEGDGSCERAEKIRKDGSDIDATIHNIRSHAHTRAKNRAIMDLCGFGEITADELRPGSEGSGVQDRGHGVCELHNSPLYLSDYQKSANYPASHKNGEEWCTGQVRTAEKAAESEPTKDWTGKNEFMEVLRKLTGNEAKDQWEWITTHFPEYAEKGKAAISDEEWSDMKLCAVDLLGGKEKLPW